MTAQLRAKANRKPVGWLKREIADRVCKACKKPYRPLRPLQSACSLSCAIRLSKPTKRNLARKRKEERESVKPKSYWIKRAQKQFNLFIRKRDEGRPCIACGKPINGVVHASHYRTTAAAPQLRFNEDNCASGCVKCNVFLSGNIGRYRENLVARIGIDRVCALEGNNYPAKLSIPEIKEIEARYKTKVKELKK